ncbi:unnamed protein product, partial [Mesorhabditis belari]|uniref:RING-type domain-containing protein n=1 Tax=Mesorhabditis belari TaxID=2138241 RepID=A0AAF3J7B0_9BILA
MHESLRRFLECATCSIRFSNQVRQSPMIRNKLIQCFACTSKSIYSPSGGGENGELPIQYRWLSSILAYSEDPSIWVASFENQNCAFRNPFRCPLCAKLFSPDQRGVVLSCGHAICEPCYFDQGDCSSCSLAEKATQRYIQSQEIQQEFNDLIEAIRVLGMPGRGRGRPRKIDSMVKKVAPKRPKLVKAVDRKRQKSCSLPCQTIPEATLVSEVKEESQGFYVHLPILNYTNLCPDDQPCHSQSLPKISEMNVEDDDDEITIIGVKINDNPEIFHISTELKAVNPPNFDETVGSVDCSECKRNTDTNDMFLCSTCEDKMLCSLCMFRYHQKMGHNVRELMQDKLNSLITATKEYVQYQCTANIDPITQDYESLNQSLQILSKLLSGTLEKINALTCLETAKSGLHLLSRLSTTLKKDTQEFSKPMKAYNKRIRRSIKEINKAFPCDPLSSTSDQPSPTSVVVVDIDFENVTTDAT